MSAVFIACGLMLTVAAGLLTARITIGPSVFDRAITLDVLVAVVIGAVALEAAASRRSETLPILLTLALAAFVGSVAVARFMEGPGDTEAEDKS